MATHRTITDIEADLADARRAVKGKYLNPAKVARCERLYKELMAARDAGLTPDSN